MLAPIAFGAAVDPPAAIASEMVVHGHLPPEMPKRRRLDDMPFPQSQRRRDRAGRPKPRRLASDADRPARAQPYRIPIAALAALPPRRPSGVADTRPIEQRPA